MKKIKKNIIIAFVLFVLIGLRSASAQTPITHTGDISVDTQAQVDDLSTSLTAGATRIVGNVTIGHRLVANDITDLSPLAAITEITGNVVLQDNTDLTNLMGLNQLQTIGGRFEMDFNHSLTSLGDFPALQSIGSHFKVSLNNALTSLGDFPALQSIGGDFRVSSNDILTSLGDFPALQSIGGNFGVFGNATLTSLGGFTVLQSIGGRFEVAHNDVLTSPGDFPALQSIGGRFEVRRNDGLTSLGDFPALQSIGDHFVVEYNDVLISLGGFPMLTTIGSSDGVYVSSTNRNQDGVSIVVEDNERLQDCCVLTAFFSGASNAVSGKVFVNNNAPGCSSTTQVNCDPFLKVDQKIVFIEKTATEGRLGIFSTLRWQLSKPDTGAEWITNIAASGGNSDASSITGENYAFITITTTANPNDAGRSTTLTLKAIDIDGNALTDPAPLTIPFSQSGTTHTGDVMLVFQFDVDALSILLTTGGATRIVGNVIIGRESGTGNGFVSDLSPLAAITEITGNVVVRGNLHLTNLMGLNQLQSIGGRFEVERNYSLTSLGDLTSLQSIGGDFKVANNIALTSLGGLTALQSIDGDFVVDGENGSVLTSLGNFPALQSIGGDFEVRNNNILTSLGDFSTIESIGDDFVVDFNGSLTSLENFSSLQSIGRSFQVTRNPSLTSLGDFTALQSIGGSFQVSSNRTLTSPGDFTTLQSIGGGFEMRNNNVLTSPGDFPALQSIGGDFVAGNNALTSLGNYPALQSISGRFVVFGNATLTSLGDFSPLTSIGGGFKVVNNSALTSLGNFTALQSIGGHFEMSGNNALISLRGLPMLASIGRSNGITVPSTGAEEDNVSIVVEGNDRLQDCCVLTEFLSGATNAVSGQIFIGDNAPGCIATTQVNCDPFLQVGQKAVFAAKTATEGTFEIFSTLRWQLSKPNTGAEWITNIAASGGNSGASSITGENDASITITTTANPNNAGRNTTLTLTAIDMAGNTLTDPAPLTISFTQWGTTHTGDVSVTTQAEVEALRTSLTAGATRIVGNVTIGPATGTSDITDLSPLAAITDITGNVVVQRNPLLPSLMGLNQLKSIGGDFAAGNNTLTSLGNYPALQSINGRFIVFGNATLTSLGNFPALQSIRGHFEVINNDDLLTSLGDFTALQTIGGRFSVGGFLFPDDGNAALISLGDFSALQSIGGRFEVSENASLTSLGDFTALQFIGGGFSVGNNAPLTSLGDFPALQSISGNFLVSSDNLTSLGNFPALQSIGNYFVVSENDDLTSLGNFTSLQSIGEYFLVFENPSLTSLGDFPALQSIGISFLVYDNAALTSLGDFPALKTIGWRLEVRDNDDLTSLGDFSALQSITGHFEVKGNDDLISLGDFLALQTIGGDFEVSGNDDLTSLGNFSALQIIGGDFEVSGNEDLISLGNFVALQSIGQTIGGDFEVSGNAVLTSLGGFPMLTRISSSNGVPVPSTGTNEDDVSILIEGNTLLQSCCVLTAFLRGATNAVPGKVFIGNNASGCSSEAEINACMAQTITFMSTEAGNVGVPITLVATASSGLTPVTFAITAQEPTSGTRDVATLTAGVLTLISPGEVTITATQAGGSTYMPATKMQIITVTKQAQDITFSAPAVDVTGTVGDNIALMASTSSGLNVSFAISPAAGVATLADVGDGNGTLTLTGEGTVTVTASQGGDDTYEAATDRTRTITVSKQAQDITFSDPSSDVTRTVGNTIPLMASTNATGLEVSFAISPVAGVAMLVDNGNSTGTLTLTGEGAVTVTASQGGDDTYEAATDRTRTITVEAAVGTQAQTIDFTLANTGNVGDDVVLMATASSALNVFYTLTTVPPTGVATLTNVDDGTGMLALIGEGTATITASQGGNDTYAAAPDEVRTITVSKQTQVITFSDPADNITETVGNTISLAASTNATGLEVSFAISPVAGVAMLVDNGNSTGTLTLTGEGAVTVTASQGGDDTYEAATDRTRTITVEAAVGTQAQTIDFTLANTGNVGDDIVLMATASSALNVFYTLTTVPPTGVATLTNVDDGTGMLALIGEGTATITASQGGNDAYEAAPDVMRTLTVSKQTQDITFSTPADNITETVGNTISLMTTTSSGLNVSFAISPTTGVATLADAGDGTGTLTLTGEGAVTVTASQGGNATYSAAVDVTRTITVSKQAQNITFSDPSGDESGTVGNTINLAAMTDAPGLFVTFSIDPATGVATLTDDGDGTGTLTLTGAGTVTVTASQTGNATYEAATDRMRTITVSKQAQTITFSTPSGDESGTVGNTINLAAMTNAPGVVREFFY